MEEPSLPPDSAPIRVLVADKTRMSTQLLARSLARDERFLIIEAEPDGDAILAITGSERPDVVLLAPSLDERAAEGFRIARQLRAFDPEISVIVLLDASERSAVVEAFRAGARGVFCRTETPETLAKCIECAHGGQIWANSRELHYLLEAISNGLSAQPPDGTSLASLSKRERDVVLCVADGLSNREIAHRLHLTEHTVKNYLFRIFDKLGVSSRVEVVLHVFKIVQSSGISKSDLKGSHAEMGSATAAKPRHGGRKKV